MLKKFMLLGGIIFSVTGCVTSPSLPVPINDDRFDGLWSGAAVIPTNPSDGSLCTGADIPIYFKVEKRVATGLSSRPEHYFTAQVGRNGEIDFRYKNAATSDGSVGVSLPVDIIFWGNLGEVEGSGNFKFGTLCPGEWAVTKSATGRVRTPTEQSTKSTENPSNSIQEGNYKKPYIVILTNDIVEAGGKPKFKVTYGDILEIVHDKTCLNGSGICYKVKNPNTGEWGFVTHNRMEEFHHIVR